MGLLFHPLIKSEEQSKPNHIINCYVFECLKFLLYIYIYIYSVPKKHKASEMFIICSLRKVIMACHIYIYFSPLLPLPICNIFFYHRYISKVNFVTYLTMIAKPCMYVYVLQVYCPPSLSWYYYYYYYYFLYIYMWCLLVLCVCVNICEVFRWTVVKKTPWAKLRMLACSKR